MSDRPNPSMVRHLERSSTRNSIVYHALVKARCGETSWVDALAWAVLQMEGRNRAMAKKLKTRARPKSVPVARPVAPTNVPIAMPVRIVQTHGSESVFGSDVVPRARGPKDEPTTVNLRRPRIH